MKYLKYFLYGILFLRFIYVGITYPLFSYNDMAIAEKLGRTFGKDSPVIIQMIANARIDTNIYYYAYLPEVTAEINSWFIKGI